MKIPAVGQRIRLLATGACGTVKQRINMKDTWTIYVEWEKARASCIHIPKDEWEAA